MPLANAAPIALCVRFVALLALAVSSWPAWSGILLTTGSIRAWFHKAWLGSVARVIRSVVNGMIAEMLIGGFVWALGFEVVGVWSGVAVAVGGALIALAVSLNRGDTAAEHRAGSKGAHRGQRQGVGRVTAPTL